MWFVERLRQADGDPSVIRAKIVCEKLSEAERFKSFVIEVRWSPDSVTLSYVGLLSAEVARADAAARHREIIEPYLRDNRAGLTTSQLVTMTHLSKKQVLAAVKTPAIAGTGKGKNQRWVLCDASDDDESGHDESGDDRSFRSHTLGEGNEGTKGAPPAFASRPFLLRHERKGQRSEEAYVKRPGFVTKRWERNRERTRRRASEPCRRLRHSATALPSMRCLVARSRFDGLGECYNTTVRVLTQWLRRKVQQFIFAPNPRRYIGGVKAEAALITAPDGRALVAIDSQGNVGLFGEIQALGFVNPATYSERVKRNTALGVNGPSDSPTVSHTSSKPSV